MNNVNQIRIIFALFFLVSFGVFAQQQDYIVGKLFDAKTNEPVVFANIRIKDRAVGIITNVDGSFRIPLKYKAYGDIIEISSMGYETKEVSIDDFSQGELNILTINPAAISLQEVVVKAKGKRKLSAKQIVQKAIDAIPKNFPSTSFSTVGYYRDYQFKNGEYINLNEAIIEVFDQGFDQLDDDTSEARIFSFDLNENFEQDSLARVAYDYETYKKTIRKAYLDAYGGNEFRILRIHDAIRNYNIGSYDYIGALKTDLIKNHDFLRSSDTNSGNETLYGIKFWELKHNYRAHGTIYISKSDFAIHKLEYTMYNNRKTYKGGKKNKHGHRQKVIFDISTEYRRVNDKMYLNYISFHNSFEVRKPPKFALDSTFVNMPGGYYTLYFNKPVDSLSAVKQRNYNIIFKQEKFKINKIEVFRDSVKLFGDSNFRNALLNSKGETSTLIRKGQSHEVERLFEVEIKNVRDINGNLVNEPDIQEYQQFREFFAQRIKPDSRAPLDDLFMDKRRPIFDAQPTTKPKDFKEYWMNTPLQEKID